MKNGEEDNGGRKTSTPTEHAKEGLCLASELEDEIVEIRSGSSGSCVVECFLQSPVSLARGPDVLPCDGDVERGP